MAATGGQRYYRGGRGGYKGGYRQEGAEGYHGRSYSDRQQQHYGGERPYKQHPEPTRGYYEEEEEEETPEAGEDELTKDQEAFVQAKQEAVKHLIPAALKAEEVRKICVDFEFDEDKINEYLRFFDIDEKYRDIEAYQWNTTQTKAEKDKQRAFKKLEAERRKARQERFKA